MDWKRLLKKAGKGIVIAAASVVAGVTLGPIAATALGGFLKDKMSEVGVTVSAELLNDQIQRSVMDSPMSISYMYDSRRMNDISEEVASETGISTEEASAAVQYALRELQTTLGSVVENLKNDRNLMMMALQLAQQTDLKVDALTEISKTTQEAVEEVRVMLRSMERSLDASYRNVVGSVSERSTLNFERILLVSRLQRQNTTLSSRFDVKYEPDLYVPRSKDETIFDDFISQAGFAERNVFLVLGDVGMGKTWFLSHLSSKTLEANIPTFFVPLRHGIRSLTGAFNVRSLSELINLIDSILAPARQRVCIFFDGLDEMPSRDIRNILSTISAARVGTISFILSCRCTDWISESIIVQGAHDLEYYIHENQIATRMGRARGASSPISVLMSEFTEEEMHAAASRYGLPEEIPIEIAPLLKKPFLLRLMSRSYAIKGKLPDPNSSEFLDLFAGEEDQAHTVLARLGILTQRDALYATVEQFIDSKEDTLTLSELKGLDQEDAAFRTLVSSGLLNLMVTRFGSAISLSQDFLIPLVTLTIMRHESRPTRKKELMDSMVEWIPHLAPKVVVLVSESSTVGMQDTSSIESSEDVEVPSDSPGGLVQKKETLIELLEKGKTDVTLPATSNITQESTTVVVEDTYDIEKLLVELFAEDIEVRLSALDLLGKSKDVRAVDPIIRCLVDEEKNIRTGAIKSLIILSDPRAIDPLREFAENEEDKSMAIKARWVADRIADRTKSNNQEN